MALFTLEELASHLQSDLDTASATLARAGATGAVVGYTGQNIESADYTHTLPVARGDRRVTMPQRPVTAITSVTVDGVALTAGDDSDGYTWDGISNWLTVYATPEHAWEYVATVEYTAGYATVPADVKAVALSMAARIYSGGANGVASESIDDYSVTYDTGSGGLSDPEMRILRRYRHRFGSLVLTS